MKEAEAVGFSKKDGTLGEMYDVIRESDMSLLLISVSAAGILGVAPLFWIFSGRALTGVAAAAGLAMINSVGSLAGVTGAMITNVAKNITGNVNSGTYVLGACLLLCCVLILLLPRAIVSADAARP